MFRKNRRKQNCGRYPAKEEAKKNTRDQVKWYARVSNARISSRRRSHETHTTNSERRTFGMDRLHMLLGSVMSEDPGECGIKTFSRYN